MGAYIASSASALTSTIFIGEPSASFVAINLFESMSRRPLGNVWLGMIDVTHFCKRLPCFCSLESACFWKILSLSYAPLARGPHKTSTIANLRKSQRKSVLLGLIPYYTALVKFRKFDAVSL